MRGLFHSISGETIKLKTRMAFRVTLAFAVICLSVTLVRAQENYEIQVYGSETVPRGVTMIELHINFTAKGSKKTDVTRA